MFRFTIRDVLWLTVTVIASLVAASASYHFGRELAPVATKIELQEAQYQLRLARACLEKHGLPWRCDE
jgi:membrane protein DedA with SNARE-associated domain